MEHDLVWQLRIVMRVPLAPVIADSICENIAAPVEVGRADGATNLGVAFQTMLCVFVPEVECAVATGCAEGAVDGVE